MTHYRLLLFRFHPHFVLAARHLGSQIIFSRASFVIARVLFNNNSTFSFHRLGRSAPPLWLVYYTDVKKRPFFLEVNFLWEVSLYYAMICVYFRKSKVFVIVFVILSRISATGASRFTLDGDVLIIFKMILFYTKIFFGVKRECVLNK